MTRKDISNLMSGLNINSTPQNKSTLGSGRNYTNESKPHKRQRQRRGRSQRGNNKDPSTQQNGKPDSSMQNHDHPPRTNKTVRMPEQLSPPKRNSALRQNRIGTRWLD
ncbi:hypothetical protein PENSUB_1080 [Penicillium subrubescens]|uniref:Uncharacterized protein n=1 Tax=Penicillium subrubescens TaxID=1316194 RepID=A0A1Q5UL90_9EURO|nr:hypothetical protein PENSUB_1080 [Penicillium subrubescens]